MAPCTIENVLLFQSKDWAMKTRNTRDNNKNERLLLLSKNLPRLENIS